MNEELARDYLQKSGFDAMQADALSRLLAETATKDDLFNLDHGLAQKIDGLEIRLRAEIVRATAEVRSDLTQAIADAQTQTMRWGIAMIIAMSTIFTLLDIFID